MNKVAKDIVCRVDTNEEVLMSSFWSQGTCLVYFLRRFGCRVCRWHASMVNKLLPALAEKNVRAVAIAPEREGWEEFRDGQYWNGEIYYTPKKQLYTDLGMKRVGKVGLFASFFSRRAIDAIFKSNGVCGNYRGDPYQCGGAFVVDKDGNMLYEFRQDDFTEAPDIPAICKACGIDPPSGVEAQAAPPCDSSCAPTDPPA
ncbi:prostamide:prostaglandin F synthase [Trichuris trichiura]|uniref:Prostamide/prostaglandin F synthase n=1 Tax=Trichuris trichiura TaxID=36087 RepID=A0A077Z8J8_TRITR|nr:prostamide:prostaglandin F synthase [Trichuris trichiura]